MTRAEQKNEVRKMILETGFEGYDFTNYGYKKENFQDLEDYEKLTGFIDVVKSEKSIEYYKNIDRLGNIEGLEETLISWISGEGWEMVTMNYEQFEETLQSLDLEEWKQDQGLRKICSLIGAVITPAYDEKNYFYAVESDLNGQRSQREELLETINHNRLILLNIKHKGFNDMQIIQHLCNRLDEK